jgi:hypothetical protein
MRKAKKEVNIGVVDEIICEAQASPFGQLRSRKRRVPQHARQVEGDTVLCGVK